MAGSARTRIITGVTPRGWGVIEVRNLRRRQPGRIVARRENGPRKQTTGTAVPPRCAPCPGQKPFEDEIPFRLCAFAPACIATRHTPGSEMGGAARSVAGRSWREISCIGVLVCDLLPFAKRGIVELKYGFDAVISFSSCSGQMVRTNVRNADGAAAIHIPY
jgi:hypothetical protein